MHLPAIDENTPGGLRRPDEEFPPPGDDFRMDRQTDGRFIKLQTRGRTLSDGQGFRSQIPSFAPPFAIQDD